MMWDALLVHAPPELTATRETNRCNAVSPHTLSSDATQVYRNIIKGRTAADLREFVTRASAPKISARSMHLFVVKYAPAIDLHIFITADRVSLQPFPEAIAVNVHASYANAMALYGKTLFDAFGRGRMVAHELEDGSMLNLSLCRLNFFMWSQSIKLESVMNLLSVDFKRFQDTQPSALCSRSIVFNNVCINAVVPSIALLDMQQDAIVSAASRTGNAEMCDAVGEAFGINNVVPAAEHVGAIADLLELLTDVHDDAVLLSDISIDDELCALDDVQIRMIVCAERIRAASARV
jgi:hypothetical protein